MLGDLREELQQIRRALTAAELAAFEARSAENLRRLRELTERGWAELHARRAAARRGEIELDPAWKARRNTFVRDATSASVRLQ